MAVSHGPSQQMNGSRLVLVIATPTDLSNQSMKPMARVIPCTFTRSGPAPRIALESFLIARMTAECSFGGLGTLIMGRVDFPCMKNFRGWQQADGAFRLLRVTQFGREGNAAIKLQPAGRVGP